MDKLPPFLKVGTMHKALKRYSPIFVLPTMLAFIIGFIVPFAQGLYLSFCKFTTVDNAKWVGVANYNVIRNDLCIPDTDKLLQAV